MDAQHLRRSGALLVSATLLASLAAVALAGPVTAAKPKCAGKTATIVGTNKGEVIVGTKKNDVIVARGGHDIIRGGGGNDTICGNRGNDKLVGGGGNDFMLGQTGRDKLFGGPGRDRLLGGPANDRFNGGTGNDACLQGSGAGLRISCERPVIVTPPPPPPPSGPQLLPLTGILAIAYSDLDESHSYTVGDVLIAKLMDTNGDKTPSAGDTIVMGKYPTKLPPTTSDFASWGVTSHVIDKVHSADPDELEVWTGTGTFPDTQHVWYSESISSSDQYDDYIESAALGGTSELEDRVASSADDSIYFMPSSPSRPTTTVPETRARSTGDDYFIDVIFLF